ncbi:mCG1032865 [Mus musculus]|nr:mCG1032865 [Mus musculus]
MLDGSFRDAATIDVTSCKQPLAVVMYGSQEAHGVTMQDWTVACFCCGCLIGLIALRSFRKKKKSHTFPVQN